MAIIMKKGAIILSTIILLTIVGFFIDLYNLQTLIIIIISIIIGGFIGGKLLNNKSS